MLDEHPRPRRVGVTGHRKLGEDPSTHERLFRECRRRLLELQQSALAEGRSVEAYSLLAIGADQIFARAAMELKIPLVGVLPFEDYPDDFRGVDRQAFESLLADCLRVVRLPIQRRSLEAYMAGGRLLVDEVDVLIAVWDGRPSKNLGGTGDVVAYARSLGRPVHIVHADQVGRS
jgi:hypothetical protein